MSLPKAVAISTGPETHLDHIGVLAAQLSLPLIVTEEKTLDLARAYYPQVHTKLKTLSELSLDYLASFDIIFQCGKFWTLELQPLLELFFNKKVRFVFCPHGNSDKGSTLSKDSAHPPQDIALIYGEHMKDLLVRTGAWEKIKEPIFCGNYRLPFYLQNKKFYDDCLKEKLSLDPSKKTILYAPTWSDKENPTSFFLAAENILTSLSREFNLIVKLHPFLIEHHHAEVIRCQENLKDAGICFLFDFPPIYPLLSFADIYLGDFSSIGYDFLAFDKPMFFLSANPTPSFLHQCGMQIPMREQGKIVEFIKANLEHNAIGLSKIRKKIYRYAFGKEKTLCKISSELLKS